MVWWHKTQVIHHPWGLSGVKPRMPGAGGSSWGSTSWSVQRWRRGFSRWRESTGTRTSAIPPTVSWTTTLPWWRPPKTLSLRTSSATPACRASRPASNRDTTAGSRAGETPGVSRGGFVCCSNLSLISDWNLTTTDFILKFRCFNMQKQKLLKNHQHVWHGLNSIRSFFLIVQLQVYFLGSEFRKCPMIEKKKLNQLSNSMGQTKIVKGIKTT